MFDNVVEEVHAKTIYEYTEVSTTSPITDHSVNAQVHTVVILERFPAEKITPKAI